MPATCGAAADVPKKLGNFVSFAQAGTVLLSMNPVPAIVKPEKVLLPPSGPTKSGFWRIIGVARRAPLTSNRIGLPPTEENNSKVGAEAPQESVFGKNAAPTPAAPAALG